MYVSDFLLENLQMLTQSSAPMDASLAKDLLPYTRVRNVLGSTEAGMMGLQMSADPEDWAYLHFSPNLSGMEFRDRGEGLYELVLVKKADSANKHQIWGTFPDLEEWPLKDLYRKHPKKANHWLYEGRTDDLIVFSHSAKFNPLGYEELMRSDPAISHVVVAGTGRAQTAAIVELKPSALETDLKKEEILENIWPSFEAANKLAPKHAVVRKTHIILTTSSKPFPRAGKGTVQRGPSIAAYRDELDALYAKHGDARPEGSLAPTLSHSSG